MYTGTLHVTQLQSFLFSLQAVAKSSSSSKKRVTGAHPAPGLGREGPLLQAIQCVYRCSEISVRNNKGTEIVLVCFFSLTKAENTAASSCPLVSGGLAQENCSYW